MKVYKFKLIVVSVVLHLRENLAKPAEDVGGLVPVNVKEQAEKSQEECLKKCEPDLRKEQTCKLFKEYEAGSIILVPKTDCEVNCLKILDTKMMDEKYAHMICQCKSGGCISPPTDVAPPPIQNAAVRYIPGIFTVMSVMYTVKYIFLN